MDGLGNIKERCDPEKISSNQVVLACAGIGSGKKMRYFPV
jgi:hypothetical protein